MKIHILGGGIGGMSTALLLGQLRERGYLPADSRIAIYEARERLGGKAVSQIGQWAGPGEWPGEHGFRFFPNFYRCIVETLKHVPVTHAHVAKRGLDPALAGKSVADLLVPTAHGGIAIDGAVYPVRRAETLADVPQVVANMLRAFRVRPRDVQRFSRELVRFLLTSHERALESWEHRTLADFLNENDFSDEMVTFLKSLRALSAMRAERGSLRTLLFTATQMISDFDPEYALWDALLPGPTDYLMLEPWEDELVRLRIDIHRSTKVASLAFSPTRPGLAGRLERVTLEDGRTIDAGPGDHFVFALPFEVARPLLLGATNLPPALGGVRRIDQRADNLGHGAEPMVGIQFFLSRDVPLAQGHVVYPRAEWAMTSISQAQFWRKTFPAELEEVFDAPGLRGILSAIVSAWDEPARRIGKAPKDCTPLELAQEAFAQVIESAGGDLSWSDVLGFHVDSDIVFDERGAFCSTPLWVSPAGSFLDRPFSAPECDNFTIASDWARTETDVGSMESADEAARWAVRAIAKRAPRPVPDDALPRVPRLALWGVVEHARAIDAWFFHHGLPHPLDIPLVVRRLLVRLLRTLRFGRSVRDVLASLPLVGRFGGLPGWGPRWLRALQESAAPELDRIIRFLEALDDGPPAAGLERLAAR
ncbi:MAG: FAD-dependent oxidoreductase [Deltaproteobacteria bacterium]|nr:FAD-dependent oxidoreductase [Deltaproteobacteria bacterium]